MPRSPLRSSRAASNRPLRVFVPTWADDSVVARLRELDAQIQVCPRRDDDPPGDPCVLRMREAVAGGAIPFSCQGPDNGLTIDGGRTLAYELADAGAVLDHLVVQVGGGALASSVGQGLAEAVALGALASMPAIHVVQAEVHAPMVRAWQHRRPDARHHRHDVMWPWEPPGTSVATGILDDEAYDWAAVLDVLERTGGTAITVTEDELRGANERARAATGIDAERDRDGGLAGLEALRRDGRHPPERHRRRTVHRMTEPKILFEGLSFGEGPRWHDGRLWVSDFHTHRVLAIDDAGVGETIVEVPNRPSGLGWLPDGRLLVVSMTDRKLMRLDPSGLVLHADLGRIATGDCNDMVVDRQGRAYVGNFGYDFAGGAAREPRRSRSVSPDGTVTAAAAELAFPNGAVDHPRRSTLILGETMGRRLTAFDIASDGTLSNRRCGPTSPT